MNWKLAPDCYSLNEYLYLKENDFVGLENIYKDLNLSTEEMCFVEYVVAEDEYGNYCLARYTDSLEPVLIDGKFLPVYTPAKIQQMRTHPTENDTALQAAQDQSQTKIQDQAHFEACEHFKIR